MSYREFPVPPPLRGPVSCTWQHRDEFVGSQLVVPDASVDLIWLAGRTLVVAGPDTRSHVEVLPAGSVSSGVRLRPGAAGSFLGLPADELRDQQVDAADLWPDWTAALEDSLADAAPDDARQHLLDAVVAHRADVDPLVDRTARLLTGGHRTVSDVAAELGVTERRLHRRCRAAVGYGPKLLARVLRLQALVRTRGALADRAVAAGYASQSHMSDDVRRLTGLTAVRFLEDRGGSPA